MLDVAINQNISVITINRPDRRNALCTEGMNALDRALKDAERNASVKAIVLTGVAPAFCAGSDLKELAGLDAGGMSDHEMHTAGVARSIGLLGKPVIAAVEGYALGGGFILAVSCDLVVTASNARWHLPEVANGWIPPWGLGALLARVGPVVARRLTWGAEPIDGVKAFDLGVADEVAEAGHALEKAISIAESLARLPSNAVRSTKEFFEPFSYLDAERLDHSAARLFVRDCESTEAKTTFAKFSVKK